MKYLITSESVSEGHPDKMCDQISDAILDACLEQDPSSRVACECLVTTGTIIVSGEITTNAWVNFQDIARKTVRDIGYSSLEAGFSADDVSVQILINSQSPDIARGVDTGGAGDQGIMFGYATNESSDYLPLTISLAHKLIKKLEQVRKDKTLDYLLPDAKTQVTIEYEHHKPKRVDTIVVSNQHKESVSLEQLQAGIIEHVIKPVIGDLMDEKTILHINPTGRFVIGGPKGDCGVTGRKIIVDTYGGVGRHGGGAFSGKDPTKVDRSGAYITRYIAKNIVASGVCERCELQISYAIGVAEPVSIFLETFGTEKVDKDKIIEIIKTNFDLTPAGIIKTLDLRKPIYQKTATGGHFGRDDVSWEKLDKKEVFEKLLN
ncbi:MAG: methionine adenosyltransferase [Candidatus Gracilibacteria bacterium]